MFVLSASIGRKQTGFHVLEPFQEFGRDSMFMLCAIAWIWPMFLEGEQPV